MSGILFFKTKDLKRIIKFYIRIGAVVWLEQPDCTIIKHGNLLLGFCQRESCDTEGMITFFYPEKENVDSIYELLKEEAETEPKENQRYAIYHFFARDPEGRAIEFQCFLHHLLPYEDGTEVLLKRRSIREFRDDPVTESILQDIFEMCRFPPSSRNAQPYYFVVVTDRKKLEYLASLRGGPSAPIGRAPLAVALCSDPEKSGAYVQDGCIAAYHFMLASRCYGLGTCWIAAMDRTEVKSTLLIPEHHYVVTVTPLGYPLRMPEPPARRKVGDFVRIE
ncbi:MAG: nitroreductase family protein [Candidatus Methanofastidiosia archaeon]